MSILKCHCGGQLKVTNRLGYCLCTVCNKCGASSSGTTHKKFKSSIIKPNIEYKRRPTRHSIYP